MRRPLSFLISAVFALAIGATASLADPAPAAAATIAATTTCSNGVGNTGGLGLICQVSIENTITAHGGSSRTTLRECHGAAGAPRASCKTTVWLMNRLVTQVTQCNGSINGGGGTLRCSVRVINTWIGVSPHSTAGTVNQCVGSGGGITTGCDPFPATTSGARVTQCNGSANGGTLVGLRCSATGTKASSHTVRINQCNGSANGGGALVICSASIVNRVRTATTAGSSPAPRSTPRPGLPETSTAIRTATPAGATTNPIVLGALALLAVTVLLLAVGRQPVRRTGRSNETPRSRNET